MISLPRGVALSLLDSALSMDLPLQAQATPSRVTGVAYEVSIPGNQTLIVGVLTWATGERQARLLSVSQSESTLQSLLNGHRIGIYPGPSHLWHMEMGLLTLNALGTSTLRAASVSDLSAQCGADIQGLLRGQGAVEVGTKADLLGVTHSRRNFLAVTFSEDNTIVPALSYVLVRVMPLLNEVNGPQSPIETEFTEHIAAVLERSAPRAGTKRAVAKSDFLSPTDEQQDIIRWAGSSTDLGIEALAGTGKTSTLRLFAEQSGRSRGQYLAFNRAIVAEARTSFPHEVNCSTAHSLAMRSIGFRFRHRLGYPRITNSDLAKWLDCSPIDLHSPDHRSRFAQDQVARYTLAMVREFCNSLDYEISPMHAPTPPTLKGEADLQWEFGRRLVPYAEKMWKDIQDPNGDLKYEHDYYLKLWHLNDPYIPADYILFDEAQDADPVMLAIVNDQQHAQLIYCGDDYQTLYEWRGAKNALEMANYDEKQWLTQSFRFGQPIADVANIFLRRLQAPKPIHGYSRVDSRVGSVDNPNAILARTNSALIQSMVRAHEDGKKVAVVGGIADLDSFATACEMLQQGRRTTHPELAPFQSWADVQSWVDDNPEQAPEVARLVNLVEKFGTRGIKNLVAKVVEERYADVTLSTVHQAKGREWNSVQLASDFGNPDEMEPEELRVAYVAVTRAKEVLDVGTLFHKDKKPAKVDPRQARPNKKRPPITARRSGITPS